MIEIPPGRPQIKYHEFTRQWAPRGDVLRCYIGSVEGKAFIWIDDMKLSLEAFGRLLEAHEGFGMRIAFVDEDAVAYEPKIEVKEPEESENG